MQPRSRDNGGPGLGHGLVVPEDAGDGIAPAAEDEVVPGRQVLAVSAESDIDVARVLGIAPSALRAVHLGAGGELDRDIAPERPFVPQGRQLWGTSGEERPPRVAGPAVGDLPVAGSGGPVHGARIEGIDSTVVREDLEVLALQFEALGGPPDLRPSVGSRDT